MHESLKAYSGFIRQRELILITVEPYYWVHR